MDEGKDKVDPDSIGYYADPTTKIVKKLAMPEESYTRQELLDADIYSLWFTY